jgi:cation:H+ antiporter
VETVGFQLLIFIFSLAVLIKGSDWFIAAAENIGRAMGIPPFIIGVTIVAFGTSLPELATSIISVLADESAIVSGNVVGSNITNILLVLGAVAFFSKKDIILEGNIMDVDMPMLIFSAFLLYFSISDGNLSTVESLLFLVSLAFFLIHSLSGKKSDVEMRPKFRWKDVLLLIFGGLMVYLGAKYTIESLIFLAGSFGIGSEIFALSLVALGTSLPEVVVSLTAAKRGNSGIAIGNVLGSNIFNTYIVMSIPSFLGTLIIPDSIINFNLPLMVGVTIMFALVSMSNRITRWEGAMLLLFYVFFLVYLFDHM